jgi:hypothetical protein
VEVGVDGNTETVSLHVQKVSSWRLNANLISYLHPGAPRLCEQVAAAEPDALITSYHSFALVNPVVRRLKIPAILMHIGFPTLFNFKLYRMARSLGRISHSPLNFAFTIYTARCSDGVLATQIKTATMFKRFGVQNVNIVLPTYTRFPRSDQYASFLERGVFEKNKKIGINMFPPKYV